MVQSLSSQVPAATHSTSGQSKRGDRWKGQVGRGASTGAGLRQISESVIDDLENVNVVCINKGTPTNEVCTLRAD